MIKISKITRHTVSYIILIVAATAFLFPLFWMISSSIKPKIIIWNIPPVWFFRPSLSNYVSLIEEGFLKHLFNSIIISLGSTAVSIFLGSMAAYAFISYKIKMGQQISFTIIVLRMMPPIVFVLPLYIFFSRMRMLDRHITLILVHCIFNLPFAFWMMLGFFQEIEYEIVEAAKIDGCTPLGVLVRVLIPIGKTGIWATIIICVMWSWNDYIYAFSLTAGRASTLSVPISGFLGEKIIQWTAFYSGGTIAALPIILLAIFGFRHLVRGMSFGAIK